VAGTIGDTIAGIGGGAQEIDQLVTAIGQIRSKGRLQGDELMQLSELGVLNREASSPRTSASRRWQLMSGNVEHQRPPRARRAAEAARRDVRRPVGQAGPHLQRPAVDDPRQPLQTLGKASWPLFTELRDHVLPRVSRPRPAIGKIFDRKDIKLGDKLRLSRDVLDKRPRPDR
jgi:hypothetical protein